MSEDSYDAIVIGSGFGSAVAITKLVSDDRIKEKNLRVLVLERGSWWRNPEGPGLRKHKTTSPPKIRGKWQYWARPNDSRGLTYLANAIYKEHNPVWDVVNPFFDDNDLGVKKNLKGMFRLSRFEHNKGNVDVVSGNAVGGGSLFYSGVNLIPHKETLKRIGLDYLTSADFQKGGKWMHAFRGKINKINTKIPVPHYAPDSDQVAAAPDAYFQLSRIPGSDDAVEVVDYEMPNPHLEGKTDSDFVLLDRARVLKRAMERVVDGGGFAGGGSVFGDRFDPVPLSVVEYDPELQTKPDGKVIQSDSFQKNTFCSREGRCILGCLPSARHTLYKTILNRQEAGGDITVQPLARVLYISKSDEGYIVHFDSADPEAPGRRSASAKRVFVGAGVLGTTEVLLRSRQRHQESGGGEGIDLSDRVGTGFSTNGDFFGFTFNLGKDYQTRKEVEDHERIGNANPTMGPINTSHFYVTYGEGPDRLDVNVEDAAIPAPFARLVHELLPRNGGGIGDIKTWLELAKSAVSVLMGREPFSGTEAPDTQAREQAAYQTERELIQDVFFYNLMGTGPGEPLGTFSLQEDGSGLGLSYDSALWKWPVFARQEEIMETLTRAMADPGSAPELMKSPFWMEDEKRVTVVHPLGGAPIGDDADSGAVDRYGRVYDASSGGVHEGLYVVDASVITGALGVNPTFTIVTQAVRTVDKAIDEMLGDADSAG